MDGGNTFGFDSGYYDFDNTEGFLLSISGAVSLISPSSLSGDERRNLSGMSPQSNEWLYMGGYGDKTFGGGGAGAGDNLVAGIDSKVGDGNVTAEVDNAFFSNLVNGLDIAEADDLKATMMSKTSSSLASATTTTTNNELTPTSNPSLSLAQTSPDVVPRSKNGDDDSVGSEMGAKPVKMSGASKGIKNSKVQKPQKKEKSSHNVIEKKYRSNINSKILALRDVVPSLRIAAGNRDVTISDLEGLSPASKLNKASVLTKATEYIRHLESKNQALKNQNLQLQRLIQEANTGVRSVPRQRHHLHPQELSQRMVSNDSRFGYVPPDNMMSFNTTPAQQPYNMSYNTQTGYTDMNTTQSSNANKFLLGGMAAMVGTSFLANDGDLQGLSALPIFNFLPRGVGTPSPWAIQVWNSLKIFFIFGALINIALPSLLDFVIPSDKSSQQEVGVWLSWVLVKLGFKLPNVTSEDRKKEILSRLCGKTPFSWWQLFKDYLYLSSSESNFENCFLLLTIGKMLTHAYPLMSNVLNYNLTVRGSLLLNMNYKGNEKSLARLDSLIHCVEGLSFLGSDSLISRLIRLAQGESTTSDASSTANGVQYFQALQDSHDYYDIVFSWRILDLTRDLNINYLDILSGDNNEEDLESSCEQLRKDVEKISSSISDFKSSVKDYFELLECLVTPESKAIDYKVKVASLIAMQLAVFKAAVEESEVEDLESSDEEKVNTEENSEAVDKVDCYQEESLNKKEATDYTLNIPNGEQASFGIYSSLIGDLSLISEEQYLVLTSSLILYHAQMDKSRAYDLLKFLKVEDGAPLTLISFTAIVNVLTNLITSQNETFYTQHSKELDRLLRCARIYAKDNRGSLIPKDVVESLSSLIIGKGKILIGNEVEREESEQKVVS